ncbi:hypothetical protein VTK73DRAFT_5725 [Phialemonium thermophilum]|uniref:Uncharacterized protein n=1 Tax=Phialemonium thermophilum TaxID=223376 RepID=A0ABR3XWZ0_9PEZI
MNRFVVEAPVCSSLGTRAVPHHGSSGQKNQGERGARGTVMWAGGNSCGFLWKYGLATFYQPTHRLSCLLLHLSSHTAQSHFGPCKNRNIQRHGIWSLWIA